MFWGMPEWMRIQKKRQKKAEEELADRMALELRLDREREEKAMVREQLEAEMTGAKKKENFIKRWHAARRRAKKEAQEALVMAREQAEDMVADREPRPDVPENEMDAGPQQGRSLGLGMKN